MNYQSLHRISRIDNTEAHIGRKGADLELIGTAHDICSDHDFWKLAMGQLKIGSRRKTVIISWRGRRYHLFFKKINQPSFDLDEQWSVDDLTDDFNLQMDSVADRVILEREASIRSFLHDLRYKLSSMKSLAFNHITQDPENEKLVRQGRRLSVNVREIVKRIEEFRTEHLSTRIHDIESVMLSLIANNAFDQFRKITSTVDLVLRYRPDQSGIVVSTNLDFAVDAIGHVVQNAYEAFEYQELKLECKKTIRMYVSPAANNTVSFIVEDNAGGVCEHVRPNMFFGFISDKGDPKRHPGNGLRYASRLMDLMGGQLRYEPIEGGSRFIFDFPLVESL